MNIKSILAIFAGAGVMPADAVKRPPRRFRITQRESSYYKGSPAKPKRAKQLAARPAHHEPRFVKHPDPILVSREARQQQTRMKTYEARSRTVKAIWKRIMELDGPTVFHNRVWNLVAQHSRLRAALNEALNPTNSKGEPARDE